MTEEKKEELKEEKQEMKEKTTENQNPETSTEEEKAVEEVKEEKEETPASEKEAEAKETPKASSGKFKDLIDKIESLTVVELAELVSELEERLGVSPMPASFGVAPLPAAGAAGGQAPAEEKSTFNIVIKQAGENKIAAIKAVREVKPELGLKEAKDLIESLPKVLKENVKKEEAEEIKKKLQEAGLVVELQ